VNLAIVAAVFPIIFIGELPDKTMFASLLMASQSRPRDVWLGAAGAFLIHVVIAVTVGVAIFRLLPHRAVEAVVALLFLAGGVFAVKESLEKEAEEVAAEEAKGHKVVTTAFIVIFLAEWGDLTQILTANLAAHYHSGISVGVGAVLALWSVALVAVLGGKGLLRRLNVTTLRRVTAVVLFVLAGITGWSALGL